MLGVGEGEKEVKYGGLTLVIVVQRIPRPLSAKVCGEGADDGDQ